MWRAYTYCAIFPTMPFAFQAVFALGSVKALPHTLSGVYPTIQRRCLVNPTSMVMTYMIRRNTYRVALLLSGHALFMGFLIFLGMHII